MKELNKKNILIVDEFCHPFVGGQQLHLKLLAETWVEQGHSVTIIAIDHLGNLPAEDSINGVAICRLYKDPNYYKKGLLGRNISTIFLYTYRIIKYAKKNKDCFDLIIFNQFPVLPALISKFIFPKQKTVLDFVEHRSSLLWKCINFFLLHSTSKVFCISDYLKEQVMQYRKKSVYRFYNCIDVSLFISQSGIAKNGYLFFGRMESHKHPEDAIKSVIFLREERKINCSLKVVGGGSLLEDLKQKYEEYSYIIFFGRVNDKEKIKILSQSKILILPSEREGLPNVVLESMPFGVPVVTTDYPDNGTKHFVSEFSIGLVAKPIVADIAEAIIKIESNYLDYVDSCQSNIHNFDVRKVSAEYIKTAIN